jgi:hypothetical protein
MKLSTHIQSSRQLRPQTLVPGCLIKMEDELLTLSGSHFSIYKMVMKAVIFRLVRMSI